MGNKYSKWHDIDKMKDAAPTHVTLFLPIFGLPNHVESFIISSSVPYPDDPLFGAFIISPWFEQVPNKLSNEEFFKKFKSTERYADNFSPNKKFIWDLTTKSYKLPNPITSSLYETAVIGKEDSFSYQKEEKFSEEENGSHLIEMPTFISWSRFQSRDPNKEPENIHFNPKRLDLDTIQYPMIISSLNPLHSSPQIIISSDFDHFDEKQNEKEEKNEGLVKGDTNDKEEAKESTKVSKNSTKEVQKSTKASKKVEKVTDLSKSHSSLLLPPSHVPFLKIALPQPQNFVTNGSIYHNNSDVSQLWKDPIYPFEYLHDMNNDKNKILPFKGLGIRQEYSNFDYIFEKDPKKPYTGLGGDGIRTEYDIFSQYKYPRKSLIAIRAAEGYNLNTFAFLPHIDTIPAHHLGTVLILDMVSDTSLTVLSQFITKTLEFLHRGCILPLIDVNIWILQLNAEKLDNLVLENEFIIEKLIEIGFNLSHIHLFPYEISPFYDLPPPPPSPPPQTRSKSAHLSNRHLISAYPLLSKQSLTHFLTPIWNTVYLKTFQLHQEGYWDRLVNRSIKNNNKIKFIPPHIFPPRHYQIVQNSYKTNPNLLKKQFKNAIKSYDPKYYHTDDQAIALVLTFASMYKTFQIKAKEYFEPLYNFEKTKKQKENQKKNQKKQPAEKFDNNIDTYPLIDSNDNDTEFKSAYELLFLNKEPLWDDPRSYLPHIKNINQFIQNPKPLHFPPEYDPALLNNQRPLPKMYRAPFIKKSADTTEFEMSEESQSDKDDDEYPTQKGNDKKIYPKFYTSQSIWPTSQIKHKNGDHIAIVEKDDHDLCKNKNDGHNLGKNNNKNDINTDLKPHSAESASLQPLSQISNKVSTQVSLQYPTLSDQMISLGLPKRYEFESWILWADQAIIADQYNMFESGYFYEPHVQCEIIKAVDQIKFEKNKLQKNINNTNNINSQLSDTSQCTGAQSTLSSHSNTNSAQSVQPAQPVQPVQSVQSVEPTTILKSLLPPSLISNISKTDHPTPFQYLILTTPHIVSRYYSTGYELNMPIWSTSISLQNRLNDQLYSRIMSRLLGNLHLLSRDQHSFFSNHTPPLKIKVKHMVPPVLRQKHYTAIAPLSYAHTRVEFDFTGGDGNINKNIVCGGNGRIGSSEGDGNTRVGSSEGGGDGNGRIGSSEGEKNGDDHDHDLDEKNLNGNDPTNLVSELDDNDAIDAEDVTPAVDVADDDINAVDSKVDVDAVHNDDVDDAADNTADSAVDNTIDDDVRGVSSCNETISVESTTTKTPIQSSRRRPSKVPIPAKIRTPHETPNNIETEAGTSTTNRQTDSITQQSKALTQFSNHNLNSTPEIKPSNIDSTPEIKPSNIEIGLTYLHRCTNSRTVINQHDKMGVRLCFYASHPFLSSVSFLPMTWLHGLFIIPFVYIASRTKLMRQKFNMPKDPIFLNRPIGECPYPTTAATTTTNQVPQLNQLLIGPERGDSKEVQNCQVDEKDPLPPFSPPNNTFQSYPEGFIPPPIPPIPSPGGHWSRHGLNRCPDQNKSAKKIIDDHQKALQKNSKISSNPLAQKPEHSLPFTIPLIPKKITRLNELLPGLYDHVMIGPCYDSNSSDGSDGASIATYHSPMTFIVLIINPIYPDPIPYSNIEIPHQVMGSQDLTPLEQNEDGKIPLDQDGLNAIFFQDALAPIDDKIGFTYDEHSGDKLDNIFGGYEDEIHRVTTTIPYFQRPDFPGVIPTTMTTSANTDITTTTTTTTTTTIPATPTTPTIKTARITTSTQKIEDLPSFIEPITQSQFRYYQEYIPILYKRQLTERIYGHGLAGSTTTKLQKLWTVEIHTPQTLKAAMKRIERTAIETRLRLYRDLVLCLRHDDEEKRKKVEEEVKLF